MNSLKADAIRTRVQAIKEGMWQKGGQDKLAPNAVDAGLQSAISVFTVIYGNPSPQLVAFQNWARVGHGRLDEISENHKWRLAREIGPLLDAAMADLESGLTTSVRVQAKGEILGDFVALAREALEGRSQETDRVAAVLGAAALEETLKQLGTINGVDVYNRDMRGVIQKLVDAGVLVGAQSGIASGFVKFRDHASHGQFELIERATTEAALAFVEGLLANRMS